MSTVTHLYAPNQPGGNFIRMYCGRNCHIKSDYLATENKDEVTCSKCLERIDNPIRNLKKYGSVHIGKLHLSLYPLPCYSIYAAAINSHEKWQIVIYNKNHETRIETGSKTVKQVARTITEIIEIEYLKS